MLSFLKKKERNRQTHTLEKRNMSNNNNNSQTNKLHRHRKKKNKTKTELQSAPVYLFARVCFHQMDGIGNYTNRRMFKMLRFRTC
jgi:hypothetical protein